MRKHPDAPAPKARPVNPLGAMRLLWGVLSNYKGRLCLITLALLLSASVTLSFGYTLRLLIDRGLATGDAAWLDTALEILLGLVALLAVASFARLTLVSALGERVIADIRKQVYARLIHMEPAFYETGSTGELVSRVTADTTLIQTIVSSSLPMAVRNVLLMVGGLVMLFVTSARLGSIVLLALPLLLLPVLILGRAIRRKSRETQDSVAQLGAHMTESLGAIKTVQSYTNEGIFAARFDDKVEQAFTRAWSQILSRGFLGSSIIVILFSAVGFVLWVGGYAVIRGEMTGGELTSFVFYAVIVASSIGVIGELGSSLYRVGGAMERILEILALTPAVVGDKTLQSKAFKGEVTFRDVTFAYTARPDAPAIHDVSFTASPARTTAIVGPSGAGKSTVFQLMMRFYDPQSGAVALDGEDIRSLDPAILRQAIAYVPQEPDIFSFSVRDNILVGRLDATADEVKEAAIKARAHEFIMELPGGYDAMLGERGCRLSTGQKQRLAIARAYLKNAPVLLMDEATSAQDSQNEHDMQHILKDISKDRTVILIAHRLSTIVHADRILVLERGRIIEQGNHAELMARGGLYSKMAARQFAGGEQEASPEPAQETDVASPKPTVTLH